MRGANSSMELTTMFSSRRNTQGSATKERRRQQQLDQLIDAADRQIERGAQGHIGDREQQHRGKKHRRDQAADRRDEIAPALHSRTLSRQLGRPRAEPESIAVFRLGWA